MQPGFFVQFEDHIVAGQLPVLTIPAQLNLAAVESEAMECLLLGILPDQVVVAKSQQGIAQLAAVKLAPELEIELTGDAGLTGMNFAENGTDIELAGTQIELPLKTVEARRRCIDIQNQI